MFIYKHLVKVLVGKLFKGSGCSLLKIKVYWEGLKMTKQ